MNVAAVVYGLLAVPAVTAFVGADDPRIFADGVVPQDAPNPQIVWQVIEGTPETVLDAPRIDNFRVQVDAWASDQATRDALGAAVRAALEDGGRNVMVSDNGASIDPDTRECRWSADFSLWVARE